MGRSVEELLVTVSSHELAEWMAYERVTGPIGPDWRDNAMAAIHDQLSLLCNLTGAAHWGDDNPVKDIAKIPRPSEVTGEDEEEEKSSEDEEAEALRQAAALSAAFD